MASTNVVLFNNSPLLIEKQPVVVSRTGKNNSRYTTKRGDDVTYMVENLINDRLEAEEDDPLAPYLTSREPIERTDYILKLKGVYYQKRQLSSHSRQMNITTIFLCYHLMIAFFVNYYLLRCTTVEEEDNGCYRCCEI